MRGITEALAGNCSIKHRAASGRELVARLS